ncbi:MAG: M3 family oligoendopeptidase [Spirochaetales bacterium]|nr:M3 family oligoendopeptidase [Spirochaetales bacterium]
MKEKNIPVWDLSGFYKDFDDPEFTGSLSKLRNNIEGLSKSAAALTSGSDKPELALENIIRLYNETGALYEELFSYTYCRYSTDTSDNRALKELGRLEEIAGKFSTFRAGFRNMLTDIRGNLPEFLENNSYLRQFSYFFGEELEFQKNQMPVELEDLASELSISGAESWSKLQQSLTSSVRTIWDENTGATKTLTELRALAFSPNAEIRKRGWEKEISLCKSIETPIAFALNGVKGFSNTVNTRRNYVSTLDKSRRQARISSQTFETLISVLRESLPIFRKYLKLKAGLLGKNRLPFYDLFAPIASTDERWDYDQAADFIVKQFQGFSSELGGFSRKAFDNNWIDALPRDGKVGGAYCTGFHVSGTSRILCNFNNSFSGLTTMAHELGHAYHNFILKDASEIYRDYPMTLAETASIFCETIVLEGALDGCTDEQRFNLIEHELMESTQVIVDILSRFIFEKNVFEKRFEGDLGAEEYCEMMVSAQKETYGDVMDENFMHPYMWLVKGHYYSPELGYYNFPYAFGKLFGLGLYSRYKEEGPAFAEKYKEVLYKTGCASAEDVTMSVGCDISSMEFWRSSIQLISEKVYQFETLCRCR